MKNLTYERKEELVNEYLLLTKKLEKLSMFQELEFFSTTFPEYLHSLYVEGYNDGVKDEKQNKIKTIIKSN